MSVVDMDDGEVLPHQVAGSYLFSASPANPCAFIELELDFTISYW
jgi:hypothetical protein